MPEIPTLRTSRLLLRPFTLADAPTVQRLAGDRAVAETTLNIPHPYPDGAAEQWIAGHQGAFDIGALVAWAITLAAGGDLIGAISLMGISRQHVHAELAYWIGVPWWNRGYCTEAAAAVVRYGFEAMNLHRVFAVHLGRNAASGRVMQKIGMTYEGRQAEHIRKWDKYEDRVLYGIVRRG